MQRSICFVLWLLACLPASAVNAQSQGDVDPIRDRILESLQNDDPLSVTRVLEQLNGYSRDRIVSVMPRIIELADGTLPEQRIAAIECLADLGPHAISALDVVERRLSDPNLDVRISAAKAMWQIDQRADLAAPVLAEALGSDNRRVSNLATYSLTSMELDGSPAVEKLVELLKDPRSHVRANAASAMSALGPAFGPQIEGPLQNALDDSDLDVRIKSAKAINQVDGSEDSLARAITVLTTILAEEQPTGDGSQPAFNLDDHPSINAAEALGNIGPDAASATAVLAEALSSPSVDVRLAAATALGEIGPAAYESIPALAKAMRETKAHSYPFIHRVWRVGDNASEALGLIGIDAMATLIEALDDDDVTVRVNALRALGGMPDAFPQSLAPLALRFQDEHPLVRIEAAKAAGEIGASARSIAPDLARLLVGNQAFTSFRAGSGIGYTESIPAEALKALFRIHPDPNDVINAIAQALNDATEVNFETIVALRAFAGSLGATQEPLDRLFANEEGRTAAACALAFVEPEMPDLKAVLTDALFDGAKLNPFAAIGLARLAKTGTELDPLLRDRWLKRGIEERDLIALSSLLRVQPKDERVSRALLEALRYAHSVFDSNGLREAEMALVEFAALPNVQTQLVAELNWVAEQALAADSDTNDAEAISDLLFDEYANLAEQSQARLRIAKILITAGVAEIEAVACLAKLANTDELTANHGEVADTLAECRAERRTAIEILMTLVESNNVYIVGGDFYGNGGDLRCVGDRAASALASLEANTTLQALLNHEAPPVRIRVINALTDLGHEAVTDDLLRCLQDTDYRVRLAAIATLGRIGDANKEVRNELRSTLNSCVKNDRRLSVRSEATRVLSSWK